ncbi:MAG: tRNA lysidine(34) synthetase TilS [Acidimicrobiia bacterium]|nr:tRNA lysidine(34) synthetase TilS [Acidimicrobiia bacterium]
MHTRIDPLADVRGRLVGLDEPGAPVTAPVVVACSGGPDSTALLALAADRGLVPIAVHVDHGLRDCSADEADAVATFAAALGTAFEARRVDVGHGGNLEARARAARYGALDAAADEHGASAVLVGHTADDQAETVVLALLRGSAASGLAGMAVRRGRIVRPLLRLRRAETEAICVGLGLEPVRDPSNDDVSLRRSWVRHEVLPLLAVGAGRDLVPVLTRQADVLRTETEYLDALARAAWPAPSVDAAPAAPLVQLPLALARRAVRCWLGAPPPSFDEVERVLAVARGDARGTELAGGRNVRRSGGCLFLTGPQ